jgi:hypothetical protein
LVAALYKFTDYAGTYTAVTLDSPLYEPNVGGVVASQVIVVKAKLA